MLIKQIVKDLKQGDLVLNDDIISMYLGCKLLHGYSHACVYFLQNGKIQYRYLNMHFAYYSILLIK